MLTNLAIFASGNGSNAENIFHYFSTSPTIKINLLLTNNKNAKVIDRFRQYNVPIVIIDNSLANNGNFLINICNAFEIDLIILSGYLRTVPESLIEKYPNKILNIHPALLPKYGGKGMYGAKVHEAVIANNEKYSGITIHIVNQNYDAGEIIFQHKINIENTNTPDSLAEKIHKLEYEYYPKIIEEYIKSLAK
ncbi:MAG TPA: phosphoribosylglycinamide formyltransferase [Bacteroidales bacterium]|nr:phosphoribosylglycinamide formyltransferase [Bacteroidales bacterium]